MRRTLDSHSRRRPGPFSLWGRGSRSALDPGGRDALLASQLGDDVPKVKPGPKPRKPQTLREASLEELIDEVSDRLTGRMADDREIRDLALRGVVHNYQASGDRLSFVSIEPFA